MHSEVKMMLAAAMAMNPNIAMFDTPKYVRSIPTLKDIADGQASLLKAEAKRNRKRAKRLENLDAK